MYLKRINITNSVNNTSYILNISSNINETVDVHIDISTDHIKFLEKDIKVLQVFNDKKSIIDPKNLKLNRIYVTDYDNIKFFDVSKPILYRLLNLSEQLNYKKVIDAISAKIVLLELN